jgi:hypothetical protein
MGSVEARESRPSTLPIPVGLSGPTVKPTVPEDEFCVATIGLVSSYALVCREDRCRPTRADSRCMRPLDTSYLEKQAIDASCTRNILAGS